MVAPLNIIQSFCFASIIITGQHWCREWRNSHTPSCPCTLIASIPAVGSCFWWLPAWSAASFSPTFAPVLLWDSWWRSSATWLGNGQNRFWTEIFSQVSIQITISKSFSCSFINVTCVTSLHCDAVDWCILSIILLTNKIGFRNTEHSKDIQWIKNNKLAAAPLFWVLLIARLDWLLLAALVIEGNQIWASPGHLFWCLS